jgi:hypothetical protein
MNPKKMVLAGAAVATFAITFSASSQSAGKLPVLLKCPATAVTVGVKSPKLAQPWYDSPYVLTLDSLSTSIPVGGKPGITCIYKGSGKEWQVSRQVAPQFKSCSVSGQIFKCTAP